MSAERNNGGPAFPTTQDQSPSGAFALPGMSLRDYFAAQFAAAWVVALGARWKEGGFSDDALMDEANRRGLQQADAMLIARNRQMDAVMVTTAFLARVRRAINGEYDVHPDDVLREIDARLPVELRS